MSGDPSGFLRMLALNVTGSFVNSSSVGFFVGMESKSIYTEDGGFNEDNKEKYSHGGSNL